jgi:histidinol-phosphate aminotransferase
MAYERDNIARMDGYVPGAQPLERTATKLNTNENPYPPSAAVLAEAGRIDAEALRRYPPPTADGLRQAIAAAHGVGLEQVIAVNGGDELLRLAITTFVEPGRAIGVVEPSYSLYPVLAQIHGSPLCEVAASEDWSLPVDLAARWQAADAALGFVVNPHAPSGRLASAAQIAALAQAFEGVLVLDEAYVDFVDPAHQHDLVSLLASADNVLLLRSLSKGYSLAGLRVGYGLGAASLIAPMLTKTRDSYNVDVIAQRLAQVAIEHRDEAANGWRLVREERARLTARLRALGCELPDSETNFVLARLPQRVDAGVIQRTLAERGVIVRYFDAPRLNDCLRITIGTPEQDDRLLAELTPLLA